MKKSIKAALLSALVFPGAGHIYLKKYKSSVILIGASLFGLYYIISNVVEKSLQIVEKIQSGVVPLNATTVSELLSKQTSGAEAQLLDVATVVIIVCWLVGIIDSYRVGGAQGKNE